MHIVICVKVSIAAEVTNASFYVDPVTLRSLCREGSVVSSSYDMKSMHPPDIAALCRR